MDGTSGRAQLEQPTQSVIATFVQAFCGCRYSKCFQAHPAMHMFRSGAWFSVLCDSVYHDIMCSIKAADQPATSAEQISWTVVSWTVMFKLQIL
jgi:hypothetical protein